MLIDDRKRIEIFNYFVYLYAIKKNNCQTAKSRISTIKRKPKTKIELILEGASKKHTAQCFWFTDKKKNNACSKS